ncbi:hypothetical protein [Bacillus cereus]|uniref:hypothetical protein n=1 Tax=Bacillus cereus TaxID=1396 RepID=UPI00187B06AB
MLFILDKIMTSRKVSNRWRITSNNWFCCKVSEGIKGWEILWTIFMKLFIIHVIRYLLKNEV